jgi:hypothetical protein
MPKEYSTFSERRRALLPVSVQARNIKLSFFTVGFSSDFASRRRQCGKRAIFSPWLGHTSESTRFRTNGGPGFPSNHLSLSTGFRVRSRMKSRSRAGIRTDDLLDSET